jgi:pSer/pThr/pTyr-binding forkhead associated (FHA) protein
MNTTALSHFTEIFSLRLEDFVRRYGNAFFVFAAPVSEPTRLQLRTLTDTDQVTPQSVAETIFVAALKTKAENGFPSFISIGRAPNNDVVIPHPSVSAFHAYIRTPKERFLIQDGGSSNGTLCDGAAVATKTSGQPTELVPGMTLRFGDVETSFLDAAGLKSLAEQLRPTRSSSPTLDTANTLR